MMTRSTSDVAVCCSSDSESSVRWRSSFSSRAFSMAMTACVGEALQQLHLLGCERPQHVAVNDKRADGVPSVLSIGVPTMVRMPAR